MSIEAIASETHAVGDWFRSTPESECLLSEERVLLEMSELVCEALERRGLSRSALADRLEISRSEVSQRLGGQRNLSLRSLASMPSISGSRRDLSTDVPTRDSACRRG
jgi:AraC-like DNA-binding protein